MPRSNSVNFFLVLVALFFAACNFWRGETNANSAPPLSAEEMKSEIPFSTREPEIYQAEIVLTNYASGEKSERKTFTARNGEKLRCDYESKISFLQRGANEKFLISANDKIYAETRTDSVSPAQPNDSLQDFLTNEWLNEKTDAKFESLGAENGLAKYRVVLAESAVSEALIFVDENFKIPVRQEFYSIEGEQKKLLFSMEVRNLKLDADEKLFQLPKDFRRVSVEEFQKTLWRRKFDSEK